MKKRHVVKKAHLVRLGSVSLLTKGAGNSPSEFLVNTKTP